MQQVTDDTCLTAFPLLVCNGKESHLNMCYMAPNL
jgi:hypothetical protein